MAVRLVITFADKLTLQNRDVERLELLQELGRHDRASITFHRDTGLKVAIDELTGAECQIRIWDELIGEDEKTSVDFSGVVIEAEQRLQLDGGAEWRVEVCSRTIHLEEDRNLRVFPEIDLPTLAGLIAPGIAATDTPPTARADYVQWGETDWDFLVRAADDAGCFVRATRSGAEIRRGFERGGQPLTWGRNLLALSVRAAPRNNGAKGWAYEVGKKEDYLFHDRRQDAEFMGLPALANTVTKLARGFPATGDPILLDHQSRAPTLGDFRERVMAESERALGRAIMVFATTTVPGISPGRTVNVADGGGSADGERFRLPYAVGEVGVVKVAHLWDGQQYRNDFVASPWANFTNWAPPTRQTIHGVVPGECVSTDDPEKLGRVQVRLPFQQADDPMLWMRMVVPYAGHERGIQFMPEVGDELVVAFEQGDPARPYVLGAVWNGKDAPPDLRYKQIVTRGGNTIRLSDEEGKEAIQIFTPDGACMLQLENAGGGSTLTIHSEGDISLEATEEIRIRCKNLVQDVGNDYVRKAGNAEKAASGADFTLTGGKVSIEADMNMSLAAGANLDASAGAMHNVVGALVHLNPPAFVKLPVMKASPNLKSSVWAGQPGTRSVTRLKHTFDPVPPRGIEIPVVSPVELVPSGNGAGGAGVATLEPVLDTTKTFIEIRMVDEKGNGVGGLAYVIELPDGRKVEDVLDAEGRARVDGIDPGDCRISFPDLDKEAWSDA